MAAEQMTSIESVRAAPDCGCITLDDPTDDELGTLIDNVSDAMARLSGMKVRGRAMYIARPCRTSCVGCCPCCDMDAIPLGDEDPVVESVWINGVQLDSSEYELHASLTGWNLVRLRSAADIAANRRPRDWPSWGDRWRDWQSTTDTPTFAIIFTAGCHIDDIYIERAANELICDLLAEESRKATSLPTGTTSADMGGVGVNISSDRISAVTERLQRVTAGELGPAFTRFLGLFAPAGRSIVTMYAPELLGGWNLNLAWFSPSTTIMAPTVTASST